MPRVYNKGLCGTDLSAGAEANSRLR